MIFLSAQPKCELLQCRVSLFSWYPLPLAKCLAHNRCFINVNQLNPEEPEYIHRKVSRGEKALELRARGELCVCVRKRDEEGGYAGQNHMVPKYIHVLIPGTCGYVMLHIRFADGMKWENYCGLSRWSM